MYLISNWTVSKRRWKQKQTNKNNNIHPHTKGIGRKAGQSVYPFECTYNLQPNKFRWKIERLILGKKSVLLDKLTIIYQQKEPGESELRPLLTWCAVNG